MDFRKSSQPAECRSLNSGLDPPTNGVFAELWYLTELSKDHGATRRIAIHTSPFTVGRRPDQHLSLESAAVSSRHAEIATVDRGLRVTDLGSTNGTFVNGQRIQRAAELSENDLVQFAERAFRINRRPSEFGPSTESVHVRDHAFDLFQFERLMSDRAVVVPYYQPIVDIRTSQVVGQEVLARSRIYGLQLPKEMFEVAAQLDLSVELSRMLRMEGIRHFGAITDPPLLFVNTHPREISTPGLIESLREIRKVSPCLPLVLEIHEAAATSISTMQLLRAVLRDLDIRLAYDDFGIGENRLIELAEAPPDFLKVDMNLVRGLDTSEQRQTLLAALLKVMQGLNVKSIAEGVETAAEAEACRRIGFDLAQGFHYGRPAPAVKRA
jgi:EAL domain-containing protein (putative c-di-GMP-specific phosphodiesterase class I)